MGILKIEYLLYDLDMKDDILDYDLEKFFIDLILLIYFISNYDRRILIR